MRHPRLAFIALPFLFTTAGLVPACGTSVEGTGGAAATGSTGSGTGAGGNSGECPADPPQMATPCTGGTCHYPVPCCGDTLATCIAGQWDVQPGPCIGEPPTPGSCPSTAPKDGDPCVEGCLPITCAYGECPGSSQAAVTASCFGGAWMVADQCPDAGGGGISLGGKCGQSADGGACGDGLACCYPCGIPDCDFVCTTPCNASDPGCSDGCFLVP